LLALPRIWSILSAKKMVRLIEPWLGNIGTNVPYGDNPVENRDDAVDGSNDMMVLMDIDINDHGVRDGPTTSRTATLPPICHAMDVLPSLIVRANCATKEDPIAVTLASTQVRTEHQISCSAIRWIIILTAINHVTEALRRPLTPGAASQWPQAP
jgi:hypothetical protein